MPPRTRKAGSAAKPKRGRSTKKRSTIPSPVTRIPPEILGEIFLWSLPPVSEAPVREDFDIDESPWVLTHVCSRWRAAAASTPALWSLIVIDFRFYDHPLAAVKLQIQRSRALKVHFFGSHKNDAAPQIQMFQCLSEHSARWEELRLILTEDLLPLLPALRDRMPLLRKLGIYWEDGSEKDDADSDDSEEESEESEESVDCFETTVSLVDVSLGCSRVSSFDLPRHLTSYRASASWDIHRQILSQASELVVAVIYVADVVEWTETELDDSEIIDLPQLQCLYVSDVEILAHLRMPVLEQITMNIQESLICRIEDLPALHRFLAHSSDTVRRLCLQGLPQKTVAEAILKAYPLLEELAFIFDDGEDNVYETASAVINALVVWDEQGDFPRMTRIDLAFHGELFLAVRAYMKMIASRFYMHRSALRSVTLCIGKATQDPEYDCLKEWETELDELQDAGLDFTLVNGTNDVLAPMVRWLCRQKWA
ncbi:hypothetical protein FB45DRAFT_373130 [Roridomyces roridus]|uniref:F-box domain-containing protein n=1 Tax=Roridomyces roridus TaxID=1738132 RepID=A0AAD7B3F2_9AGAR|nr:hypothetical protein FB45DRAFT_1069237 [Roridomyces roridus]KAJ7608971.1 hypothetical protein FB45DRAFT_373130 [Roridomyces roridus]